MKETAGERTTRVVPSLDWPGQRGHLMAALHALFAAMIAPETDRARLVAEGLKHLVALERVL